MKFVNQSTSLVDRLELPDLNIDFDSKRSTRSIGKQKTKRIACKNKSIKRKNLRKNAEKTEKYNRSFTENNVLQSKLTPTRKE